MFLLRGRIGGARARAAWCALAFVALAAGCASRSVIESERPVVNRDEARWCAYNGGRWRPELNFCEYEPRFPIR